jgi:hypothetical protein
MSRPASVFIGGTLVTLVAGSLSLDNRIEERSTASFTIIDLTAALSYQRGQVVEVLSGDSANITDVGSAATDRDASTLAGFTLIDLANPAKANGNLDTIEVWAQTAMTGFKVATFYTSAGGRTCRAVVTIGDVTAGSKQTFSGLSLAVQTGDFIGCYFSTGYIERDSTGGTGVRLNGGDVTTPGLESSFNLSLAGAALSLYAPAGTKLFAGFIETPEEIRDGNGLLHTIQCKDNHYLADKRLVVKSYANKTLAFIVNDILTDYLAAEGITAGTIQTGPTISEAIFNYVKASECFDALKELSGFLWQINEDKTLDFIERNTNLAPWALTTTEMVDGSAHLSTGNPAYRNRQYIRGGTGLTGQQTENFTGDAVVKAFTVGYPLASVPTSVKVNAVTQTIGIKGIDTGKDCYWNKGDATITFDTAPGNGLTVEVIYYGQYPLIVRADSPVDIAARLAVEGGTGIVEEMVHEAQHESADAMRESASAKLQRYCQDAEKFSFQTRTSGLKSGQLLTVTYSPFGFASYDMLIESVKIAEEDSAHLIYSVVAITGPVLGSWSKFFANILTRQDKTIKIGDMLLLVLLLNQEELEFAADVTDLHSDDFSSGLVNRWIALPPTQGAGHNIQHELLTAPTEAPDLRNRPKGGYVWG